MDRLYFDQRRDSQLALEKLMVQHLRSDMVLYVVGCGNKPFKDFLHGRVRRHIGIDLADGFYARDEVDLIGSADAIPATDGSADAVLSSMVHEHLPDPVAAIREANRVLRPGGYYFISCPFLYPVHAVPYDFSRLTRYALQMHLEKAGFDVLEIQEIGGFWYVVGTSCAIYLRSLPGFRVFKVLSPVIFLTKLFFRALHWLEGSVIRAMGKNPDDIRAIWAMSYIVLARKSAVVE